jgi:hypothetical protein
MNGRELALQPLHQRVVERSEKSKHAMVGGRVRNWIRRVGSRTTSASTKGPWTMADDRNRLPVIEEPLYELNRSRIHTQPIRIHDTARKQQRVVLIGTHLFERPIDLHVLTPLRLHQLVLLEAVRRKRSNTLPFQLISHEDLLDGESTIKARAASC